jgi:hypothetical protein
MFVRFFPSLFPGGRTIIPYPTRSGTSALMRSGALWKVFELSKGTNLAIFIPNIVFYLQTSA